MAVFRNVLCPLCNTLLNEIKTEKGLGGGGDIICSGCNQRVSYFCSVMDSNTLYVRLLTLPAGRNDPGEKVYRA